MSSDCVNTKRVKVLYIAGMIRSGSTLLGRLLGELPSAAHVGEMGDFFLPGFREKGRCECREPVLECPFWKAVFERAFGGADNLDWDALVATKQAYRFRTLPRLLFLEKTPDARLQEYISVLDALYAAVRDVSGASIIVDGSKDPLYGYLLLRAAHVDLRAVHLVRDSRAVAYSTSRLKSDPPLFANPHSLAVISPARTAMIWNAVNGLLSVQRLGANSLFLRYEDVVQDPEAALSLLWNWIGEPPPPLDFLGQNPITLSACHTVAGNPDRFQSTVRIRLDDAWQRDMKRSHRRLVTSLTWPLLLHYGYLRSRLSKERIKQIPPAPVL